MKSHIFMPKAIDTSKGICFFRHMTKPAAPESATAHTGKFVDDHLLFQLASASQKLSAEFHGQVKASGVKVHVWRVLACVVDQPGLMLTSLSRLVLYEQSRLTKIIGQMDDQGLVLRRPVAGDRRKMAIFITPKGREIVSPLLALSKEHEIKALKNLTNYEQAMLKRVLGKLNRPQQPAVEGYMS